MVRQLVEKSAKKVFSINNEAILRDGWGNGFFQPQRRLEKN
jgi:hypothetical protein